jgi:hypothetical protein
MTEPTNKPGRAPRPPLRQGDVRGLKYFNCISALLEKLHGHKDCHNRQLHYDELAMLLLLHYFNPALTSLRSLVQASDLKNVRRRLGVKHVSLGSLSEASRVFDPTLLRELFAELAGRIESDPARLPAGLPPELAVLAVDGTLLEALPRMAWALWLDSEHRALKVHLEFDILKGAPAAAAITDGNGNEKEVLRESLQANKLYALDAGYARFTLFEAIRAKGSSFVARLHDNSVYELVAERPLTAADQAAGVVSDKVVWLGSTAAKRAELSVPLRLIAVHIKSPPERGLARRRSRVSSKKTFRHRPEEYDLLLASDRLDLSAEMIALLYRQRWQIELFFRWLKCLLGLKHLVFESREGATIQIYCALIASLLISLWTGRKPTKRTLEMVQFYFQGWADLEELEAHIAGLPPITR